jgi:hypothetical protein
VDLQPQELNNGSILPLLSLMLECVTWVHSGLGCHGQNCELGLFCMQKTAPVTVHIENSIAGVFANWIFEGEV